MVGVLVKGEEESFFTGKGKEEGSHLLTKISTERMRSRGKSKKKIRASENLKSI